jgi:hypothetical protein
MRLDVVSLAPEAFAPLLSLGVIGRAFTAGIAALHLHNPRDHATDRYRKVDDEPYGGGAGMVLKPEPVFAAFEAIPRQGQRRVLLMSPQGRCQRRPVPEAGETRPAHDSLAHHGYSATDREGGGLIHAPLSCSNHRRRAGRTQGRHLLDGPVPSA